MMISSFRNRYNFQDTAVAGGARLRSAPSTWVLFTWQTASVPASLEGSADGIRPATMGEAQQVVDVILNALSLDSAWNDTFVFAEKYFRSEVERLFAQEEPSCLVIPKGNRFVAASLIDPSGDAGSHLLSGPVVLEEYRNRGLGSRLLHASLAELGGRGIKAVNGMTRSQSIAAKHVYTKFGGVSEPTKLPVFRERVG